MKAFITRLAFFLSFILFFVAVLTIMYWKRDVYLDFGHYENYSWKYHFQPLGDLSTKKLLQSDSRYNSFIFGSSRTTGLYACYLQKKIPGTRCFHYGNWNETIGGISSKISLLDARGYALDNVVIYLDTDFTFAGDGACTYDHYLLTGVNRYHYYYNHYLDFFSRFNSDKMNILAGRPVQGEIFPNWHSDKITNDGNHTCSDTILLHYGASVMSPDFLRQIDSLQKTGFLYQRPAIQQFSKNQISMKEAAMLMDIKRLLQKHHSKYYIVITPLYDQLKFARDDQKLLEHIFGDGLYDFSGINRYTANPYNYPDRKHFLPWVSKDIIDSLIRPN